MRDPFKIDSPTAISFSGGRTSAYMLWRVLQSNGGLPDEAVVCFANTGKEDEATLRFVRDCQVNWAVPISWVEYRDDEQGYALVDFDSASRNGEPFEAIIRKRNYLPNPVTRFCTVELKIRVMHKHLRALWDYRKDNQVEWDQFIGIRADEPRRVAKIRARPSPEIVAETMCLPLADAGVSVHDVNAFWDVQPFNLELPTYKGRTLAGNCDLCFLKPANQVYTLIQQKPERGIWWAKMEASVTTKTIRRVQTGSRPATKEELDDGYEEEIPIFADVPNTAGALFRSDRPSYQQMLDNIDAQAAMFADEEIIACFCGD